MTALEYSEGGGGVRSLLNFNGEKMQRWKRLAVTMVGYLGAVAIAGCADLTTAPQVNGLLSMKPKFDYWTETVCGMMAVTYERPATSTNVNPAPGHWIQDTWMDGNIRWVVSCHNEYFESIDLGLCRDMPYHSSCQTVQPLPAPIEFGSWEEYNQAPQGTVPVILPKPMTGACRDITFPDLSLVEIIIYDPAVDSGGIDYSGNPSTVAAELVDCQDKVAAYKSAAIEAFVATANLGRCFGEQLCLQLIRRWAEGSGDLDLTSAQFDRIRAVYESLPSSAKVDRPAFTKDGVSYIPVQVDFYQSANLGQSFGGATVILRASDRAVVGFYDFYDMNKRTTRTVFNELATSAARTLGALVDPVDYHVRYGITPQ